MLITLKLLNTKAQRRLMPQSQIAKVTAYLDQYEPEFEEKARRSLGRINTLEAYAQAARKLATPVNVWLIPYPNGHKAVLATPNELSLAAS